MFCVCSPGWQGGCALSALLLLSVPYSSAASSGTAFPGTSGRGVIEPRELLMGFWECCCFLPTSYSSKTRTSSTREQLQAKAGELCWGCRRKFQWEPRLALTSLEATKHLLCQEAFLVAEVSAGVCCCTPPGTSPEQEFCLLPQPALVTSPSPAFFPSEVSSQQLLSSWMQFGTSNLVALPFGAERNLHFGVQGDFSGVQSHPVKYELVESKPNYVFQILNNYIEGIGINYYYFKKVGLN